MIFPWSPVIAVDILGSISILLISLWCIVLAKQWSGGKTDDIFRHYIFLLTLIIGVFAVSRSFGHLAKQIFITFEMFSAWGKIAPFSGAVNTATFIMISAFCLYFHRFHRANLQVAHYKNHLEKLVKERTATLRDQLRFQEELIDSFPSPIFFKDSNGNYLGCNTAYASFLGFTREKLVGKRDFDILPMGLADKFHQQDIELLEKGGQASCESFLPHADGINRNTIIYKATFSDHNGNTAGLIGTVFDVSERKSLERQLRQAQKMETIGRLAGGMAHDFNNILSAVIGYSELALMELSGNDPMRERFHFIKEAGEKAASLTNQLLAFSRKQVLEMKVISLFEVIGDMTKMLRRIIGEDIELELNIRTPINNVMADPGQLEQVLLNLAVNARDAMPNGGRFLLEIKNFIIDDNHIHTYNGAKPGSYVLLAVTDTGSGISHDNQEKIFEPFFTTKEVGKGTGLGLAMVYGIIKQHKGYVYVDSELGKGTTFEIYLPAISAESEQIENKKAVTMPHGSETVLVVEDDLMIRKLVVNLLEQLGYTVLQAATGEEALTLYYDNEKNVDLLLADVVMPGMNGRQLADVLMKNQPGMKVVYMSGYTDDAIARHGVLETGLTFIQKPLSPTKLANKLRMVLNG